MKAILVIDMPESCSGCPLFNDSQCDALGKFLEGTKRYEACPLRPLPDKQKNRPQTGGYTRGFTAGFNKFRYLITGETE